MPEVEIAQLSDGAGGTVTYYLTYDAALKVTRFRCDNRGGVGAFGELVQRDGSDRDGLKLAGTFRPGTDTRLPVPTAWGDRLQLVREPDGDLVGIDMDLGTQEAPGARRLDLLAAADGLPRSVRGPVRIPAAAAGAHGD